jgi:hypothetical protein
MPVWKYILNISLPNSVFLIITAWRILIVVDGARELQAWKITANMLNKGYGNQKRDDSLT